MKEDTPKTADTDEAQQWVRLASLGELQDRGRMVIKEGRKQIALFLADDRIYACNNRCPHEGYPLSEGHLTSDCVLTCNWHNWKFDLSSGETLIGGDELTIYETRTDGDDVFVCITEPTCEEITLKALRGLRQCFELHEYDRMAREVARLMQADVDPLEAVRKTIGWTYEHFEFGTTHAVAATADWLSLASSEQTTSAKHLTAIVESIGHFAWDSRREPRHAFATGEKTYDADILVAAIEDEDEDRAVERVRGAFAAGLGYPDIEPALARAALAHYQDFGHALIYVYKTGQLVERLGDKQSALHLSLMMVRSLVFASREDLLPEFKAYRPALETWDGKGTEPPLQEKLVDGRTAQILSAISGGSADAQRTYDKIMEAVGWQLLHYDMRFQTQTDKPVSQNVTWLGFTHALTFGNAVREMGERYPELLPAGLLQLGCFLGRNAAYADAEANGEEWQVADPERFLAENMENLYDHGNPEFIVSCHLVKILTALAEEVRERPRSSALPMMLAGVNRFLNSPLKRKHTLRSANQAMQLVASEG
jgi:nitrite reductase/ring-hydroxylating ferredoxin subunit